MVHNSVINTAMILSAGLGTRLKPWTLKHPKALVPVAGKSLLQRNIEWLQQFGIHNIVVNVHHFAEQIIDTLAKNNGWGSHIQISDETDEVLETGGGLLRAAPYLPENGHFILMNADVLTDLPMADMLYQHLENNAIATLATTDRLTSRYLLFDQNEHLCGWENILSGERIGTQLSSHCTKRAFSGIHVINSQIFKTSNKKGKFSIIDWYLDIYEHYKIQSFDHSGGKFVDVGKPDSIEIATKLFG
jgi:NDP-sugar pyrophosphorylase family protein